MFTSKVSEGCREIASDMKDHPERWIQTDYEFVNIKNKDIRIWTTNGVSCIKLNGNDCFNSAEQRHINRAIKSSIAKRLASNV